MHKCILFITVLFSPLVFALPHPFVYLHDESHHILQEIRYATKANFIGKSIIGYHKPTCILTKQAAQALLEVAKRLQKYNLGLKVYDCYRPQQAVDAFVRWSQDGSDQTQKHNYYPHINKSDVFKLGYIAEKSGHSRGSTVDVSLIDSGGHELEMGTHFDYLDTASHPDAINVSDIAKINRQLLRTLMLEAGFQPSLTEWWHYTLHNEPFPNTYFNFPVS